MSARSTGNGPWVAALRFSLTLYFLLDQKAVPKKLGFVVSSPPPKTSPALLHFIPKVTTLVIHVMGLIFPKSFSGKASEEVSQQPRVTKGDPGCRWLAPCIPDAFASHYHSSSPALEINREVDRNDRRGCGPGGDLYTNSRVLGYQRVDYGGNNVLSKPPKMAS